MAGGAKLRVWTPGLQPGDFSLVPLAEMFGYATDLRSKTQGRATYTMQFSHYAETPRNIEKEIIGE